MRPAFGFLICGWAERIAVPEPLSRAQAIALMQKLLDNSQTASEVQVDLSLQTNCNLNADRFCYDNCVAHCIYEANSAALFNQCGELLPEGCRAVFGGARLNKLVFHELKSGPWLGKQLDTNAWRLDWKSLVGSAQAMLADLDEGVEITDAFILVPGPSAKNQQWREPGEVEPVPDEDDESDHQASQRRGSICSRHREPSTSAVTSQFSVDAPNGAQKYFGAQEKSGFERSAGFYYARRGWRVFQNFFGHWENELFKNLFVVPVNPLFISDDVSIASGDLLSTETKMQMQNFARCSSREQQQRDEDTRVADTFMAWFMLIWGKAVDGRNSTRLFDPYTGFELPRLSESCNEANNCLACQKTNTVSGTPCVWCMTVQGQSCQSVCEDTFNTALDLCVDESK